MLNIGSDVLEPRAICKNLNIQVIRMLWHFDRGSVPSLYSFSYMIKKKTKPVSIWDLTKQNNHMFLNNSTSIFKANEYRLVQIVPLQNKGQTQACRVGCAYLSIEPSQSPGKICFVNREKNIVLCQTWKCENLQQLPPHLVILSDIIKYSISCFKMCNFSKYLQY